MGVPRCPRPDIIADVHFIVFSPKSHDAVQLRCLSFLFLDSHVCERKSLLLPFRTWDHVDVALQLNSFMIPYHINFLKPLGPLSYPQILDVPVDCTHHIPNYTLTSPVM